MQVKCKRYSKTETKWDILIKRARGSCCYWEIRYTNNSRLNQKKIETIKNYEKKPIFAFTLLEESITITDKKTKNNLNNQIRKYENKIRSITNCVTDEELSKVCKLLDNIGKEIDMIVNKRNFI